MSHFRRTHKPHKDITNLGIQADPPHEEQPCTSTTLPPAKSATLQNDSPNIKKQKVGELLESIEKVQNESKILLQRQQRQKKPEVKRLDINMMKIQDKTFHVEKNIYNIAVGQIFNKETYLTKLTSKIQRLKEKVQRMEEEQQQHQNRTIQAEQSLYQESQRSRTIETRKSQCGKFYFRSRGIATSSDRKRMRNIGKDTERSSFFKWRPQLEEQRPSSSIKMNSNRYSEQSSASQGQDKDKEYIKYRVKQRNLKPPQSSKVASSNNTKQVKGGKQMTEANQRINTKTQIFSIPNTEKTEHNPEAAQNQHQSQSDLQPYSGIIFKDTPQFEITQLSDDFRDKINKQLQIPEGFPMEQPQLGLTLDQIQELGPKVFQTFGVKVQRQPTKLLSRKFKNGVYYHLGGNKNILWYYTGAFYLGGWDSDLPLQGQKQGLGFQYIPDKYTYLGQFKDGVKHGKGSIKLNPTNPNTPDIYMAYEGQWLKGKPHGFGKHIDEKNTKYIGHFLNGDKTGSATIITQDGIYYKGGVVKGIKNGYGMEKLINGDTYTGQFQNGHFHGQGNYQWKNGSTYIGQFFKGKRQGKGTWKGSNGDIFEGQYHNDLKNGWGKFVWTNGQIYQGQFKDDVRHGEGIYRHPSGKMGRFMWKQGQVDYRLYNKEQQQYRQRNLTNPQAPTVGKILHFEQQQLIQ